MWNNLHRHLCWHTVDHLHLSFVFLHGFYHLIMKYTACTTNLLRTLFFLTLLDFYFVHFQELILILKNPKFIWVILFIIKTTCFREFKYQDTTLKLTRLILRNVCIKDEDIYWRLFLRNDIIPCLSNDPVPILKKS